MRKVFLMIAIGAAAMMGCSSTDDGNTGGVGGIGGNGGGGQGGMGGSIGPITWVASDQMVVGDTCGEFFDPNAAKEFEMTIQGSDMTLAWVGTSLVLTTDDYMETDDEVTVTEGRENSEFDPCVVQLDNAITLGLDDPDVSIDQNDTLTVSWFNTQAEVSMDECEGVWGFNLPCEAELSMTLTQTPPPSSP